MHVESIVSNRCDGSDETGGRAIPYQPWEIGYPVGSGPVGSNKVHSGPGKHKVQNKVQKQDGHLRPSVAISL